MVKRAGGALLLSIAIDRASSRPISTPALRGAARPDARRARFAAGERLPASRTLARDLGIVAHHRDRGLRSAGLRRPDRIARRRRHLCQRRAELPSGRAAAARRHRPDAGRAGAAVAGDGGGGRPLRRPPRLPYAPRAFITAMPAFDAFPMAQWARLAAKHWRGSRGDVMGYGEPLGYPPLRQAIAAHLRGQSRHRLRGGAGLHRRPARSRPFS